jgi:diadenosine tetraphosphatase ApaH/serine/threonine PP2A family protein phosphatase
MMILGGRSTKIGTNVPIEIYDTENSEFIILEPYNKFRLTIWNYESLLYAFAGFDHTNPSIPTNTLLCLNLNKVLNNRLQKKEEKKEIVISPPKAEKVIGDTSSKQSKSDTVKQSIYISNVVQYATTSQPSVKYLSIDKLGEEPKKIGQGNKLSLPLAPSTPSDGLPNLFISKLLRPKEWVNSKNLQVDRFPFKPEMVVELAKKCASVLEKQGILLNVRVPIKIFGDIHGQYTDLMRFFDFWRSPTETINGGDIESFDYLFLGDYVDRGYHSLETICLLMALKVKYPKQIHMLRGNHEDRWINNVFGFAEECAERIDNDIEDPNSVFSILNSMFEYLPLAAVIEDQILCIHGGIGSSIHSLEDIMRFNRPLEVVHDVTTVEQQMLIDLLWSDPTDNDEELGIQPNAVRDPNNTGNIVKFGPDRVENFLKNNNLTCIIRGHECVMDGFERFAKGQLITVFSATDYCARHKNAGAMLVIQKDMELVPRLIFPVENTQSANWIDPEENAKVRPSTPPRWKVTSQNSYG